MVLQKKSVQDVCEALHISRTSWYQKIHEETSFTVKEVNCLRNYLKLDDKDLIAIFFN